MNRSRRKGTKTLGAFSVHEALIATWRNSKTLETARFQGFSSSEAFCRFQSLSLNLSLFHLKQTTLYSHTVFPLFAGGTAWKSDYHRLKRMLLLFVGFPLNHAFPCPIMKSADSVAPCLCGLRNPFTRSAPDYHPPGDSHDRLFL